MRGLLKVLARSGVSAATVASVLALAFFCAAPSTYGSGDPGANAILIRFAEPGVRVTIQDSKWGPIGQLQAAIDRRAEDCGITPVALDGRYTRATADAMRAVAACRGAVLEAGGDHVTVEAWQAVTGERPPNALERAQTLARTMEGGDYDRLDWNVCVKFTGDQGSVLTWGPYGKTLGWGGELLGVLNRLDRATVLEAFASNGAQDGAELLGLKTAQELGIASKHKYPGARALMESICAKPGQMQAWSAAFAQLGAMTQTQALYEEAAWGDSSWFRYVVERLEQSWRRAGLSPTEVDFAFFLDRSIHMGWGEPRFDAVDDALQAARYCLAPQAFTNARARLVIADAVRAKARPEDRLARDAMFLVDAQGSLAEAMKGSRTWPKNWRKLWSARTGIAASDVGLSDERPAPHFGQSEPS